VYLWFIELHAQLKIKIETMVESIWPENKILKGKMSLKLKARYNRVKHSKHIRYGK
jgi:hypothetical protein